MPGYSQLVADACYYQVEVRTEGVNVAQFHFVPTLRQPWRRDKRMQSSRTNAEEPLREDAAIERAFRGEVTLVSFGPCFHRIRHVLAEQPPRRVALQEFHRALRP